MLGKIFVISGASIFAALGTFHLYFTFFSNKFLARDENVTESMKGTSPILTGDTTMWKAWIGFNASHSLGAMSFGAIYILLAVGHEDVLRESWELMALAVLTALFYLYLAKQYWFRIPFIGILAGTVCFCLAAIAFYT